MPNPQSIRSEYTHRPQPEYFADTQTLEEPIVYQPDVYTHAAEVAEALGATRIVDFGCGTGGKLAALSPRFEIVGIDYGPNLEICRATYPVGTWVEDDFGESEADVDDRIARIRERQVGVANEEAVDGMLSTARSPDSAAGTPEQVVERLRRMRDLGCEYAILYFPEAAYDRSGIELFEQKVIPALR